MPKITITLDIAPQAEDGYARQKMDRLDQSGSLSRIAAANRGIVGTTRDDDQVVILKAVAAAAVAAAES